MLDRRAAVSRVAAHALATHLGAAAHVRATARYLLGGAGDFTSALVEAVARAANAAAAKAARDARRGLGVSGPGSGSGIGARALRDALASAIRESSAASDPLASRLAIDVAASPPGSGVFIHGEDSVLMTDVVDAAYRTEWPTSLLFATRARVALADARRATLRLRHVVLALDDAHRSVLDAGGDRDRPRAPRDDPVRALARRRCRKLALLSAEFRHFARALERFVVDAHESATETLVARLAASAAASGHSAASNDRSMNRGDADANAAAAGVRDVYELRDLTSAYCHGAREACLLSPRDAGARESVDRACQLALDFRVVVAKRRTTSALATDAAAYAAAQATHAKFRVCVQGLCERLRDEAANRGGRRAERAAKLLAAVDFNGFYSGNATPSVRRDE